MSRTDTESPSCIDNANGAHQAIEIGEGFAHPHENDVVDLFAALPFDGDDLIDNFIRTQVSRKAVETARAKLAAVRATDLRRDANWQPVRSAPVKRGRGRNQNRFDQVSIAQSKQKLPRGIARSQHADAVALASDRKS